MENTIENATAFLDELSDAFPKMRFSQAMVEYAASVRPEVVVPSEKWLDQFNDPNRLMYICIERLKSINPTITFTERKIKDMESQLTDEQLIEAFDIVFDSTHSDGFKKAEIKDLLFDNKYRFIRKPKHDWFLNLFAYLESIGYDKSLVDMNHDIVNF